MEHSEFEHYASALRTKVVSLAESFFQEEGKAQDVAQEAMIRLWKAWPALPSLPDAERLAVRIAKHECIDAWRTEQRRPHTSLSLVREETRPAPSDGHSLEENELKEAIRSASGRLRRSEERLWRMFAEAGMQPSEIALATGIHVRTVSAMLSHARHIIYNILKERGYIDE